MKFTVRTLLGSALSALAAASCSSGDFAQPSNVVSEAPTGEVRVALVLGGATIQSASYQVTGPNSFTRSGTIDVRKSNTISTTLGGMPAGAGYSISIAASSVGGGLTCAGSATFAVTAHAVALVTVPVLCGEGARTGSALINGVLNSCPVIDGISTDVAEVNVGGSIAFAAAAHDSDAAPFALAYGWTATKGTLSGATTSHPVLSCTEPGSSVVSLTATDGACSDALTVTVTCTAAPMLTVYATVETDPVPHSGDAADDPAIWVNPLNAAESTIIGTDKTSNGGLGVYDLAGHQIQYVTAGALNNVDLRAGFPLGGQEVALVTAGNRTNNSIAIFKIDPVTRMLTDVAARTITTLPVYGSCMYHSQLTGKFYYFVDSKAGNIEQWELFDNGAGLVDAVKVRDLPQLGTQPEACVADDELGYLYIGEEDVGIWKFSAEPGAPDSGPLASGVLVDGTGPGGHLVADVEGLAIAKTGSGTGYLLAANQGDNTYAMYTREGSNSFVKLFSIAGGACTDEVSGSDGIDVVTQDLGPAFPFGLFVTQDDTNGPSGNQNFKLVAWDHILNGPPAGSGTTCSGDAGAATDAAADTTMATDAGQSDASASDAVETDAPVGFPSDFCATFCGKCDGCWGQGGFSEGDCLYQLSKPNFSLQDCLAGCAIGRTPGFPPSNLQVGWESLSCTAFDDGM